MAILNKPSGIDAYFQWYTGFGSGNFYGSPGLYNATALGDVDYLLTDNSACLAANPPPFQSYDPRCRPWYSLAVSSPDEVMLTDPYSGEASDTTIYLTLTSYNYLEGAGLSSVAAFDLNLNEATNIINAIFNNDTNSNKEFQHISRMFYATANQQVIMTSTGELFVDEPAVNVIIPDIAGNSNLTEQLRN
jgi:hypothetical protein